MGKKPSGLRPKFSVSLGIAVLLAGAVAGLAAQKKGSAASGASLFAQDKGKLTIKLDGQTVGHEDFEITPSGGGWLAKGDADIKASKGPASKVSGSLTLEPDGAPISYEWTSQTEKTNSAHLLFTNGLAKMTLQMQGAQPFDQTFTFNTPLIAVLDNNLYHQYAILARLYDWSKRGPQTFPVLIPQELMPGNVTAESTGSASIDGKSYEGFRVNTTDLEIDLYLDSTHRLMRLEAPTAKVSVIRD
jgi:hypothetical protein